MMLYEYLASDYLRLAPFSQNRVRRVSTVIQMLHSIKHFYWVKNPQELSAIIPRGTGLYSRYAAQSDKMQCHCILFCIVVYR